LSTSEIATTDGSLTTIPFPGKNTRILAVPRSIPIFLINTVNSLKVKYKKEKPQFKIKNQIVFIFTFSFFLFYF